MSFDAVKEYVSNIKSLDTDAMNKARQRLESLAKPPGSLGRLEEIAYRLAGICGEIHFDSGKRGVIVMAADNGVYEEGVAATPQSVTLAQTINITKGITGVSAIAKQFSTDIFVVDVGVNAKIDNPLVKNRKIRKSTWNIAKGAAMTYQEAVQAVLIGIETAIEAVKDGYGLLGCGEMGIGNTTTSAAVLCALTGLEVENAAGKGAGLSEEAYKRKIEVIKTAIRINTPDSNDPIDVLAKVGGFDIAAMAGVYIGGAYMRTPIVADGFISMVAALVAARIAPMAVNFMFASHASYEQGYKYAAKELNLRPYLDLDMRLGEGSGCPVMFAVIDAACAMMKNMGTFKEAAINDDYVDKLKNNDSYTLRKL